ncbi:replication-associated protein [Odonata associated gemycircularvirus 1]|uniref:Replication-associated protein n=1 Tax=Odonata associated gemycircularvirus 1 TaxID=1985390 RepID=A0A0B4UHX2_9VIRU|nr:replication-associated protein [Odonata associated gemycircularvirus 1]AJD07460.1 replication-associated protein [Odonata associated gemycircularvirus 1]
MPSFCTNARHFLITYAQCGDLSEWNVLDKFSSLGAECIIAREYHADLGLHLHVFVDFGRKFRSRKTDIFDVDGRHPNIKRSWGTPEKGYDYAIKDGEVVAGGLERPDGVHGSGKTFDLWSQVAGAEDRGEFWRLVEELDPKALCCSFTQLSKFADWRFAEVVADYESPGGIGFVPGDVDGRDSWVESAGLGLGEPPVGMLLTPTLEGGNGSGQGPYPPPSLVVGASGVWYADVFLVDLVLGVHESTPRQVCYFDDIRGGIKFFPAFKEWLGGQQTVSVKRLYRDPKLVRWGKPSIWISNDDPRHSMEPSDISWMEANARFIEVREAIYFSCQ